MIVPFDVKPRIGSAQWCSKTSARIAVGGPDREQVEHDRLERDDDRAEGDEQEQEREREHEGDHVRRAVLHLAGEVDVLGRDAGDRGLDAGMSPNACGTSSSRRMRDSALARCIVAGARERELDRGRGSLGVAADGERRVGDPTGDGELLEAAERLLRRGRLVGRPRDDEDRRRGRARERLPDVAERRERRLALRGERLVARLPDVERERRERECDEQAGGEGARKHGAPEDPVDHGRPEARVARVGAQVRQVRDPAAVDLRAEQLEDARQHRHGRRRPRRRRRRSRRRRAR